MNKKTILGTAQLIQQYGIANKELNYNNKTAFQILNQSLKFGINRWEELQIDPQANVIEPFPREGINTVLNTLDTHSKCK